MMHTKHKEALIILGGYIIKPFLILFLNLTPTSFKKKKLIPLIVKITKCNWKIGYLITLYLSHYVKQLFKDENFVISITRFGYYLKVPVTDNHFLYRLVGLYHPEKFLNSIEKEIKGCKHICEIGTHLGELSAWFKNIQPLSKFTAFELHPEFTKFVQDSFKLNHFSNYEILNAVVGLNSIKTKGYCDFDSLIKAFPELHVAASLEDKFFTDDISKIELTEIPLQVKQEIKSINLVDYFLNDPPDFYFMDIEGCEVYALPMIMQLNNKFKIKSKIVFEIHHYAYSGEQAHNIKKLLIDNNYKLYSIDNRHLFCV